MPRIFEPSDLTTQQQGAVTRTVLADPTLLGSSALYVEHLRLAPGGSATTTPVAAAEHFLYVIRGSGVARAGAHELRLQPESLLWLEPGEPCSLRAEAEALEVLICQAPAGGGR